MVLSPHSHCSIEHSERILSEETLTDEKRSLALFVKQVMSVCLKGYEYKIRVISADEQEAVELKESVKALKLYQLYVLIEAKNVLEQVADAAGIAEAGVGALFSDVVADQGLGLRREDVALAAAHFEDLEHLLRGVVLEQQETVEAALQTGVGVDEFVHQLRVARHDDHQIVSVVLHSL